MFRTVEEDPRDLTAARRYLGVYLLGAARRDGALRRPLRPQPRPAGAGTITWRCSTIWSATSPRADAACWTRPDRPRRRDRGAARPAAARRRPPQSDPRSTTDVRDRPRRGRRGPDAGRTSRPRDACAEPCADAVPDRRDAPAEPPPRSTQAHGRDRHGRHPVDRLASAPRAQAELQQISQAMLAGRAQQGRGPGGRQPARHRHHDPRLLGLRARRAPQAAPGGSG